MILTETPVAGAYLVEVERVEDDRGFFARTWCAREFEATGLNPRIAQCSVSFNPRRGTLRGLHHQAAPYGEAKVVRCTMGSIYDVVVDLRPESPTHVRHFAIVLSAQNRRMLYVPQGCAHGFLTLEDDTEVFYQTSESYVPEAACGVRWDDPAFGIRWPAEVNVISDRDRAYPDYAACA